MQVKDVMTSSVIGIQSDATIAEAIDLMLRSKISGLPVFDAEKALVGMLSEGDLLRRAELGTEEHRPRWIEFLLGPGRQAEAYVRTHGRKVEEVMSAPAVTITATAPLGEAIDLMSRRKIKRLPVLDGGAVVGMVTRADVLRALAKMLPRNRETLADADLRDAIVAEIEKQKWAPIAVIHVDVTDGVVAFHGTITDERERQALRVVAENMPGVRAIRDHLVWVEPNSGVVVLSPEDEAAERQASAAA